MYLYGNTAHKFHTRIAYQRPRFLADSSLEWTPILDTASPACALSSKKEPGPCPRDANLKRSVPIAPAITRNDGGLQPSQNEHLQKRYRGEGVPNPALRAIIKIESGGDWPWIFSRKFCGSGAKVSAP